MMRLRQARTPPQHARPSVLAPTRRITVVAGLVVLAGLGIAGCAAVAGTGSHGRSTDAPHAAAVPRAHIHELDQADQGFGAAQIASGGVAGSATTAAPSSSASTAGTPSTHDVAPVSALTASGIPTTALAAYQQAVQREATRLPGCGITWPLLAGIGRVESNHGRFAGAILHADGVSVPRIIGIPLDGHGTALIRDTDGGRLDGDTGYDRAVGPMQFIPSTWAGWGVDADHNGTKDPNNVFDAAAAAADYLCAAGRNLHTYTGQVQAVRSYNNSDAYITMVLELEREYASGAVGVTIPVLPTDPNPAHVQRSHHPKLPPVDPGHPRGYAPSKPSAPHSPSRSHSSSTSKPPSTPTTEPPTTHSSAPPTPPPPTCTTPPPTSGSSTPSAPSTSPSTSPSSSPSTSAGGSTSSSPTSSPSPPACPSTSPSSSGSS